MIKPPFSFHPLPLSFHSAGRGHGLLSSVGQRRCGKALLGLMWLLFESFSLSSSCGVSLSGSFSCFLDRLAHVASTPDCSLRLLPTDVSSGLLLLLGVLFFVLGFVSLPAGVEESPRCCRRSSPSLNNSSFCMHHSFQTYSERDRLIAGDVLAVHPFPPHSGGGWWNPASKTFLF